MDSNPANESRAYGPLLKDSDSQPFWDGANEGVFRIKGCKDCRKLHWYPRPVCPYCMSAATEWISSSGQGTVYSVTVTRKLEPLPYVIAFVTLDEGVTVLTNVVNCDFDRVRIGDRVHVVFKVAQGGDAVPVFTKA